jgi:hypothetical protein
MASALANHVWGKSPSADRVWAQVAGIGSRAGDRVLVALQAFVDESYVSWGSFVFGGCIANAETWAAFSRDWEVLLPEHGRVSPDGRHYFHTSDVSANAPENELFWRVIEKHDPVLISCQFKMAHLERAKARLYVPGVLLDWAKDVTPYSIGFRCLMDKFHESRQSLAHVIPPTEVVDFYFDNEEKQKKYIYAAWDSYLEHRSPEVRKLYSPTVKFEDDKEFKPLQAADFWAGWVRRWYDGPDGSYERMLEHKFPTFTQNGERWHIDIVFDEDALANGLGALARSALPYGEVMVFPTVPVVFP